MPYAVALVLDPEAGAEVRRIWWALEDAGIASAARRGADPHLSVGIWETLDLGAIEGEIVEVARSTAPPGVTFGRVDTFPHGAVFLAPREPAALLALHVDVHRRIGRLAPGAWAHYVPGAWVPHCTLATHLTRAELEAALPIARRAPLPIRARLTRLAVIEFPPARELGGFAFG